MTLSHQFLPLELSSHQKLPEQFQTLPVTVSLRDKNTGASTFARVSITDKQGEYWPPRGHQKHITTGFRKDVGGDIKLGGKTFAYVKPDFTVELPPGKYQIETAKGIEYEPVEQSFHVKASQKNSVEINLKRWANMAAEGWYSGDTHVHFYNANNALLEIQAEDLNVVNVLATKLGELITEVDQFTGAPSPVSLPGKVVYFNEETRHGFLGHTILHPIQELVYPLTWGEPREGVPEGLDYPTMAHQADKVHAQGGLVTWAHFPNPTGELAIDIALDKIDSIEVFTWGNSFNPSMASLTAGSMGKTIPGPVAYWYKFLNTGFKVPVTAGTDKMFNTQVVGSVRTYAYTGNKTFNYTEWIEAIRQGRTMVTTGPLISLKANGQDIGSTLKLAKGEEVLLEATLKAPYGRYPWEKFEIVQNGKAVAVNTNPEGKGVVKISARISLTESAWFAARVYSNKDAPPLVNTGINGAPAMAHTSPIYIELPESKIWSEKDAEFLLEQCDIAINWATNTARYHSEEQRSEVIELFKKAKSKYMSSAN